MVVLFTGTESTFAYFEATRQYLGRYGKPLAFYSDKASVFRINRKSATGGDGHKELRLEGISTIDAANALMPSFIYDYNRRFGKLPRDRHNAHRAIRDDEHLDTIFAWRETRKVTSNLTLHYERKLYLLPDTPTNRRYAGKYVDVLQYPDGRIEIQVAGVSLPYSTYDKLGTIDQGAIVEHKRLGHVLRIAQVVQAERDNRAVSVPSTAHRVTGTHIPRRKIAGTKTQRELGPNDLRVAIQSVDEASKSAQWRLTTLA
jgi:hypothetical protein